MMNTMINLRSVPTQVHGHTASQDFMDLLLREGFHECPQVGGIQYGRASGKYTLGKIYYFKKNGECTICFLKDGRIHVLYGPLGMWELNDYIMSGHLRTLMAFASLQEDQQTCFRNYMSGRCTDYDGLFFHLPKFEVDWKQEFRDQYSELLNKGL